MALYRKYRPATFAEVAGQEHVTEPLSTALDTGRISHAYLFSGPRGCGKTSSARILARSLNCAQGPTSTPCGVCLSCVALAPGGPGNLDVIELDAASHGGVDDTRELRDRAFYAPAESRYRVFIVDEAHMVTTAGFNALLKIVEEPPAHLIFIFATTEPDKVLPTIRSRTHHYPFRLLASATMRGLLGRICEQEQVPVSEAVYPLVIRAGGGSPRDSLSVLDQLLAGAGPEGVTYPRAVALLGVTDVALIDDAIDALATADGAALFGTVDRMMEAGHDPRRFAIDLLERLRDLILLRAVPDAADRGLVSCPGDVLDRMRDQVQRIGPATVTRYAELLHEGLGEMRGATAPRLLLEVICARMLLPSVSDAESATLQRLERLERGLASGAITAAEPSTAALIAAAPAPSAPRGSTSEPPPMRGAETLAAVRRGRAGDAGSSTAADQPGAAGHGAVAGGQRESTGRGDPPPGTGASAATASGHPGGVDRRAVRSVELDETSAGSGDSGSEFAAVTGHAGTDVERGDVSRAGREHAGGGPQGASQTAAGADHAGWGASEAAQSVSVQSDSSARARPAADEASPADQATGAAAGADLLRVVEGAWPDIRAKVQEFGPTLQALLSGASVARVEGEMIVFAHQSPPLAQRLSDPRNLDAVRSAVRAVLGRDHDVRWEAGGNAPRPATSRAGGAGTRPRGPRRESGNAGEQGSDPAPPPRFSRPSRARGAIPDKAAGAGGPSSGAGSVGGDDDIPPPDYPDLPDDPGPADFAPARSRGGYDIAGVVLPATQEEEQEMLTAATAAADPVAPGDRRDPDEVALDLLRSELGATRLDD